MRRVRSWWSSLPCVAVNTCLCVAFTTPRSAAAEPHAWPRWGGPHGDFKVEAKGLAEKWPDGGPRRLWSRPLGPGYSAIVAGSGRLYTMYRDGDRDVVIALNAADGKTIWEHGYTAKPLKGQRLDFGTGPNATPLLLGDRLIAAGFTGVLKCLSTETGKPLWSHDLVAEFGGKVQEFGYSASPLPYKGNVIVLVGGDRSGVMALDPADGRVVWKSA
ncbi:MAG: PQQ-binding-like beta-propeller repeat protein, partial [Phycisphaerae bacterium]